MSIIVLKFNHVRIINFLISAKIMIILQILNKFHAMTCNDSAASQCMTTGKKCMNGLGQKKSIYKRDSEHLTYMPVNLYFDFFYIGSLRNRFFSTMNRIKN